MAKKGNSEGYEYSVVWDVEEGRYKATCNQYPKIRVYDETPILALSGMIRFQMAGEVVSEVENEH